MMKKLDSAVIDEIKEFIDGFTVTDVTPSGCKVKSIETNRSHRGRDWTNMVITFHYEDTQYMNRKNLTLPVPDKLIDMCNNSVPPGINHVWGLIIAGSLRKAGFFESWEAKPEKDALLF